MKRNIIVGLGAALFGLFLISVFGYVELRYTSNGAFWREWATKGAPSCRFDDCVELMTKWVRIHEFVESPFASCLVGLLVGSFCRGRCWFPLLLGVMPIVFVNCPSDVQSTASGALCILIAWVGAKSAQAVMQRFSAPPKSAVAV